ncbi:hypothetical protein A2Z22_03270 [Candidatus Woesebacteria bacterium RBG_16_34_12]|uniref:Methyltransferase small domain-containing protein n=1 Tax=Candidatus Woesebacteria bacterium RBG_16_34_12 TaxID=1802480 RepID=A0A1F7XAM9_9BACT|nr:MAG: hypothetical protein A2Z22_03270 [Candidatus Woesebacteria bacterium RBG_16_34_12]
MAMNDTDPYYKKQIPLNYQGKNLVFRTSQVLFSSHDIDVGTKHLLRTLTLENSYEFKKALDLGCGYGPIGIALKSISPDSFVHMVDRDALALDYSQQNMQLNNLNDIKIYGSLGYDNIVDTDFDLIVSNIPAKVGEPVLEHMLLDAGYFLKTKGKVAVVVIEAICDYISGVLNNSSINILFSKKWPGHTVFIYEFTGSFGTKKTRHSDFQLGIYDRGEKTISFNNQKTYIRTAFGIPEYDTLSFETELIIKYLKVLENRLVKKAIVFNPSQGYIPVVLSKSTKIDQISIIDRNLESLMVTKRNLVLNNFSENKISVLHQIGLRQNNSQKVDLVLGTLSEDDNPETHRMLIKQADYELILGGLMIISSGSTAITRIEGFLRSENSFHIQKRERSKRKSILVLEKKYS